MIAEYPPPVVPPISIPASVGDCVELPGNDCGGRAFQPAGSAVRRHETKQTTILAARPALPVESVRLLLRILKHNNFAEPPQDRQKLLQHESITIIR
jgi:hypothetical protein